MSENTERGPEPQNHLLLNGLDGANPLGFLAAIGAFRLLATTNHRIRMGWRVVSGTWHPMLFGTNVPIGDIGTNLHVAISKLDKSVWSFDKKLPFSAAHLRQEARCAVLSASTQDREKADAVASLGVEFCVDDDGNFKDSAFRMVRSGDASQQGLLAYGQRILESTTAEQIYHAVTGIWQYDDEQCALRWDPAEDRGYALQWRDPGKVGARSVKAANCLALVALPMFPTVPVTGQARTTGFGLKEPKKSSFTWPIWNHALCLPTVRSLLALSDLQLKEPPRAKLAMRGIIAAYRSDRIMTTTYYANFTPSQRVA